MGHTSDTCGCAFEDNVLTLCRQHAAIRSQELPRTATEFEARREAERARMRRLARAMAAEDAAAPAGACGKCGGRYDVRVMQMLGVSTVPGCGGFRFDRRLCAFCRAMYGAASFTTVKEG